MEEEMKEQEVAERGALHGRTYHQQVEYEAEEARFKLAEATYLKRQEEYDLIKFYNQNVLKFSSRRIRDEDL
jgi:hypothetical protein